MKIIFWLSIFLSTIVAFSKQDECNTERINTCMIPTLLAGRRNLIPQNENDLEKRCNILRRSWKCVDKYMNKCVEDVHHMAFDLLMEEAQEVLKEWCDKGSQFHKDFLEIASCFSEAINNTHRICMKNFENVVYKITGDDIDARVPAGCCYFNQFYECFYDQVEKSCGTESFPIVKKASKMMYMTCMRDFCSSYDPSSDLCIEVSNRNVTSPSEKYSYLARFVITMMKHRN